jgi:hypothetical protein
MEDVTEHDIDDVVQMNDDEIQHFKNILKAFSSYEEHTLKWLRRLEKNYDLLSPYHKSFIPSYPDKLQKMSDAISVNQNFIFEITESNEIFQNQDMVSDVY